MSPLIAKVTDDPAARHVFAIKSILEMDLDEISMGVVLREYCEQLQPDQELFCEVHDRLAKEGVISKINFRKLWDCK